MARNIVTYTGRLVILEEWNKDDTMSWTFGLTGRDEDFTRTHYSFGETY
jgi:hypothetical protein